MSALAQARSPREFRFKVIALPLTAGKIAYQGGMACVDSGNNDVRPGEASNTGLVRVGNFAETLDNSAGSSTAQVLVELDKEVVCQWYDNDTGSNALTSGELFESAYILDDHTVSKSSGSSTRSVAGRVWAVDSVNGVAVETTNL